MSRRACPHPATPLLTGDPIAVGNRELIPVLRGKGTVRRGVSLSGNRVAAWGHGVVHARPIAIVVCDDEHETYTPIPQTTRAAVVGACIAAIAVPFAALAVVYSIRKLVAAVRAASTARGYDQPEELP